MTTKKLEPGTQITVNIPFAYTIGEKGPVSGNTLNTIEDCEQELKNEFDAGWPHGEEPFFISETKETAIDRAKQTLEDAGYFTGNLWQVDDVKNRFKCHDSEAQDVLDYVFNGERLMQIINGDIEDTARNFGLIEISDTEHIAGND